MGSLGGEHPGVAPSGGALARNRVRDMGARQLQLDRLVRPRGADEGVAVLEHVDLDRCARPVLLDQLALLRQERDGGVELLLGQLVRVLDAEARL